MKNLIRKAREGDKNAFCTLMDENLQIMYKIAWTYLKNNDDVADVIQDTICSCYEKIGQLKKAEFFRTWLIRILINHCYDILDDKKQVLPVEVIPETACKDTLYEKSEWHQVMRKLTEEYQAPMILYYLEEMPVKEIAELLELPENTVKSHLYRGRKQLLKVLEGK